VCEREREREREQMDGCADFLLTCGSWSSARSLRVWKRQTAGRGLGGSGSWARVVGVGVRGVRRELMANLAFNCVSHCSLFVSYELFKNLSSPQWGPGGPASSVEVEKGGGVRQMRGLERRENCPAMRSSAQNRAEQDEGGALGGGEERGEYATMWRYMAVASAGAGAGMVQVRSSLMVREKQRRRRKEGVLRCTPAEC
jgi:hypothetical protein